MKKPRGVDAKLERLRLLRHEADSPALVEELRRVLREPSHLLVATAAAVVGERHLAQLAADLAAAFDRFMTEEDKQCRAKNAIVEALNKLDYDGADLYLRGIRHVHKERLWDGAIVDYAAPLRGNSAFGLVRILHPDRLNLLVELLADPDKVPRIAAVQGLASSGCAGAEALLRYKARVGDVEPEVIAECLTALGHLAPAESLFFVKEFLHQGNTEIQEGAAFALAESRRPEAIEILKEFWPNTPPGTLQEVVLLAISMLRLPAALDFVVEQVTGADQAVAAAAISALAIHRHNERVKERVAAAVEKVGNVKLSRHFETKFS
jgi:HEAT repeat protein